LKCFFPDGPCQINPKSRKRCIYCRLSACLQAGMHRNNNTTEEITRSQQRVEDKHRSLVEQKYTRAQLVTLDLLHADRSSLNTNQWSVISNITHIYDRLFDELKQKIHRLHMFDVVKPIKMRLKALNYQQLVVTYFTFIPPFLERIPDYESLKLSDRLTLIHQNMIKLTGIHSHYMASITGFIPYFHKNYAVIMNMIYGSEIVSEYERLRQRMDTIFHADLILIKLVLVIFTFSNVTPYLSFATDKISKSMKDEMMFSKELFAVQNDYVDILWRYMLFRFRHEKIVVRLYSNIVYNCLHVQNFSRQVAEQNDLHKNIFDNLIEKFDTKLNLQDEI